MSKIRQWQKSNEIYFSQEPKLMAISCLSSAPALFLCSHPAVSCYKNHKTIRAGAAAAAPLSSSLIEFRVALARFYQFHFSALSQPRFKEIIFITTLSKLL